MSQSIEPGKFVEKANEIRNMEYLEKLKQDIAEAARKSGLEKELELVSNIGIRVRYLSYCRQTRHRQLNGGMQNCFQMNLMKNLIVHMGLFKN
jgi:hypothetical protein